MDRVMSCGEAVRHLWEFLDQALPDEDHRAVEEHLAFCIHCCGEMEFARELRQLLQAKDGGGVPCEVRTRLERFVEGLGGDVDGAGAST